MTSVNLFVANPDGQNSNSVAFNITSPSPVAPVIVSISPSLAVPGDTITVNGSNFVSDSVVKFGSILGTNVVFVSSTKLTVAVPSLSPGTIAITVQNPDSSLSNAVNITIDAIPVPAPEITLLNPTSGSPGATVAISGTGFVVGAKVKFGSIQGTNVVVVSSTQITVTVPSSPPGVIGVVVENPDAQLSGPLSFTVTLPPPPNISSISPTSGPPGTTVIIKGSGFTSNSSVLFGSNPGIDVTVVSPTEITVVVPSGVTGLTTMFVVTSMGRSSIAFTGVSSIPNPLCRFVDGQMECWDILTNSWVLWVDPHPTPTETSQDVMNAQIALLSQLFIEQSSQIALLQSKIESLEASQLNFDLTISLMKAQLLNSVLLAR